MKWNRSVDALIHEGNWLIEPEFAARSIAKYFREVAHASVGGFNNYHESRKAAKAAIIDQDNSILGLDLFEAPENSIFRIRYNGVMLAQGEASTPGADNISDQLYNAYSNPNVDGILVELSSGGGQAEAGAIINNAISDANKPIVVYTHLMASAAIYGFANVSEIIASSEQASIGSIGAMVTLSKKRLDKFKKNFVNIYSEKSPRKNEDFNAALNGDFSFLKEEATRVDEIFMDIVRNARNLKGGQKRVNETLSGAMFPAVEAKSRGLIDGIGNTTYALDRLRAHIKRNKK